MEAKGREEGEGAQENKRCEAVILYIFYIENVIYRKAFYTLSPYLYMVMWEMDIEYIITESKKMGKEKALRYLRYHGDLQYEKKLRYIGKIKEINGILDTIRREIHRREQQDEIVEYNPSQQMGMGKEREEEVKERE